MRTYVSIIIPVYNSEKYLEQCLNSVLNQSYTSYEVILIDDGSTDNSKIVYKKFVDIDKRFVSYYQRNQGVSAARNRGLDVARGDVIIFLDSDDIIAPTFLETIVKVFEEGNDLICFSAVKFENNIKFMDISSVLIQEYTVEQIIENLLYHRQQLSITRSAFRRKRYSDLHFREELYICEDVIMLLEILISYNTIIPFIETKLYGYRIHKNSLTHYGNWRKKLTGITAMDIMESVLGNYDIHMEKALINRRMNSMRLIYKTIPWREKEARSKVWEDIRRCRNTVIFDQQSKKRERLAALVSLCGQRVYRLFLLLVENIR